MVRCHLLARVLPFHMNWRPIKHGTVSGSWASSPESQDYGRCWVEAPSNSMKWYGLICAMPRLGAHGSMSRSFCELRWRSLKDQELTERVRFVSCREFVAASPSPPPWTSQASREVHRGGNRRRTVKWRRSGACGNSIREARRPDSWLQ